MGSKADLSMNLVAYDPREAAGIAKIIIIMAVLVSPAPERRFLKLEEVALMNTTSRDIHVIVDALYSGNNTSRIGTRIKPPPSPTREPIVATRIPTTGRKPKGIIIKLYCCHKSHPNDGIGAVNHPFSDCSFWTSPATCLKNS